MFSLFIIATLLVASNATPVPNVLSSRVYDGEDASIKDFPYQVSIEYMGMHNCGGSIVGKNWIITAGHCAGTNAMSLKVRAGSDKARLGGSLHQVVKIIRHEKYRIKSSGVPVNDIALMRVRESFEFDETRQTIDMVAAGTKAVPGKMANVSGFGWIRGNTSPNSLQWVQVPLVEYEKCNQAYKEMFGGVPEGYICASYFNEGGRNACKGDSGGPLTTDGKLAGIVSWSYNCAEPKYPTVYTDVAFYRNWIDKHLQMQV